jgi:hypothetical protein
VGPTQDQHEDPRAPDEAADDLEGHSLAVVMGLDAMRRGAGHERERGRTPADEELAPLTKPFPRLRDDARE